MKIRICTGRRTGAETGSERRHPRSLSSKPACIGVAQPPAIICRVLVAPVSLIARSVPRPACRRCDPGEHHEFRATAVAHRRRSIGGGCEALRRGNLSGLRSVVGLIACRFSRSRRLAMRSGRNTMNSVAAVVADHACPVSGDGEPLGPGLAVVEIAWWRRPGARPWRQTRIYRPVYVQRNKCTNTALSCDINSARQGNPCFYIVKS